MKAWHIMIFLLLFNLSISVITTLHIYPLGISVSNEYNVTSGAYSSTKGVTNWFFGSLIAGFIGGAIMASFVRAFTRIPSAAAYVYSIFATEFWVITGNAFSVLWNIAPGNMGMIVVITIFGIMVGAVFLAGMLQIVAGAWSGIE